VGADSVAGSGPVKTLNTHGRAQQQRHDMEGDLARVRLAEAGEHFDTATACHRRNLAHETALADARWADHADHSAVAVDCTIQQPLHGRHLPPPTDQIQLGTPDRAMLFIHAQQPIARHRLVGTLDPNQLRLSESCCVLNQSRCRCAEHHPAGRGDRFHPLRHPDLLTNVVYPKGPEPISPAIT
jgi:hypothetical protein